MTRRPDNSGGLDDSYQIDAVVSLFAVLLVMLLTLTAATAASTNDVKTNYRPTDSAAPELTLKSLQVPYRLRQLWLLEEDGRLRHVDLAAISRRLEYDPAGGRQEFTIDGVDILFETVSGEPGSYRVGVKIWDPKLAAWAIKQDIDLLDANALTQWAGENAASVVVLTTDDLTHAGAVSAALAAGTRSGSLFIPRRAQIYASVVRRAASFSAQGVFRAN